MSSARRATAIRGWRIALALLVVAQWGTVAWVASAARHVGALYGDPARAETMHAASRALMHGHLPAGGAGPLWTVLTLPFAAVGPQPTDGLAELLVLQAGILLPLALVATVSAAARLVGRRRALLVGLVWILLPLVGYGYLDARGRPPMLDDVLPQLLGLAPSPAFAAVVMLSVTFALVVRALDDGGRRAAAAAGAAASVALVCSSTTWVVVPTMAVAFALARRPRQLAVAVLAALPGVLLLVVWLLHAPHAESPLAHWDLGTLHANVLAFREYGWSFRVVEWVGVAATVAALRLRSPAAAAGVVWFWLVVLLRGSMPGAVAIAGGGATSFLGLLLPAFPPFVLLVAALPLLLPGLPARIARKQVDADALSASS